MILRAALAASLACLCAAGAASATALGRSEAPPPTSTATVPITTLPTTTAPAPTTTAPATTAPAPVTGKPSVTFVLSGHGWGHGLGMSQWGARGYAERGWTYDRILAHYYPGATLAPAPAPPAQLRVLLVEKATSVKLASAGAWSVVDAEGQSRDLEPGKLTLGAGLKVGGRALAPPLSFRSDAALTVGKAAYRGTVTVDRDAKGKLLAIDVVGLEDYLRGVVPAEMPQAWPAEALKAQAVAARSYALAGRVADKPWDLYADTRSQVYLGVAAERPSTDAAVAATAGQVLTYSGQVVTAYFSASSGGRTAAPSEGPGKPLPYLRSVPDPYDESPYRDWTATVDGARAAAALGLKGPVAGIAPVLGPSGRVVTATLSLPDGQAVVTGPRLRAALGLRSTWFTLGLLSLTPPPAAVAYGSAATLAGLVRGVASPVAVEQRTGAGPWSPGPPVTPAADGTFSLVVRPARTTDYRLGAGSAWGTPVRVAVGPSVALRADGRGTVAPAAPGKAVQLQRRDGSAWRTVAVVPVAAGGSFAAGALAAGTYRARYAPGAGVVAGASPPVDVR